MIETQKMQNERMKKERGGVDWDSDEKEEEDDGITSKYEWTSQGHLRLNLEKVNAPERWEKINLPKNPRNGQVWIEVHLNYRKELVRRFPLESDADDNQDILDEIEYDQDVRREQKEIRKEKERRSQEYIAMLRRQK